MQGRVGGVGLIEQCSRLGDLDVVTLKFKQTATDRYLHFPIFQKLYDGLSGFVLSEADDIWGKRSNETNFD